MKHCRQRAFKALKKPNKVYSNILLEKIGEINGSKKKDKRRLCNTYREKSA